jgi:hypothetical protein
VLGLANPGLAKTVLCWNGGKKIHLCGGVDANNVYKFKCETKQFVEPDWSDWSDEDKRRVTEPACKSGNVETMVHGRSLLQDETFQQADGKAWETGIALIRSHLAHPTPESRGLSCVLLVFESPGDGQAPHQGWETGRA